jgi:hypothetical protein
VGHAADTVENRKLCKILVQKKEGKRLLERPKGRCEDVTRIDFVVIGVLSYGGFN